MTSIPTGSQIAVNLNSEIILMSILSDNLKMDNKTEMKIDVLSHKIQLYVLLVAYSKTHKFWSEIDSKRKAASIIMGDNTI